MKNKAMTIVVAGMAFVSMAASGQNASETESQKKIRDLEERVKKLEAQSDNLQLSDEKMKALNEKHEAKQKGQTQTYGEMTALQAYESMIPPGQLSTNEILRAHLFDYLAKGFECHGYLRSGYGINSSGGHMEAFQAPGAPAKYRLGNEEDTYVEAMFKEKNWNPDPGGVQFTTQLRLAYKTFENESWDESNKLVLREAYVEMGKFMAWNPDAMIWAGERFYRLPELNINDFWWYDMSGYGGGLENMNLGFGRLAIAWIGYSKDASAYWTSSSKTAYDYVTSNGRLAKNNLNIMLSDLNVPFGKGTFWVNGGYMNGGVTAPVTGGVDTIEYPSQAGLDGGFMHQVPGKQVQNQFALQYGYGCNSSLSSGANLPPTDDNKSAWIFRTTEMLDVQMSEDLCAELVGVYQYTDSGADTKAKSTWASMGMRPIYNFTRILGVEIEPGLDYVESEADDWNSYLFKFTTGLRITPDRGFNSRPEFRLFATYAHWGNDFKGQSSLGGEAFRNKTEGMNFGVQAEHWW